MSAQGHLHVDPGVGVGRLRVATGVVILVAALEIVVGRMTGSLALLSDAGHLATDAFLFGLSWYALARSRRPPTRRHTYGFHRTGIVVASINGIALFGVAVVIALGAAARLQQPTEITALPVMAVATMALVVNIALTLSLAGGSRDLATRSALFHIGADAVASVGVIAAAAVILISGWQQADAIVSVGIAALIAVGAVVLLREALGILSEAVPRDIDVEAVRDCIASTAGVLDVHDLHIWALDRSHRALSAHVAVGDQSLSHVTSVLRDLESRLCADYGIEHATLQPECPSCAEDAAPFCDLDERHAVHAASPAQHV